MAQLAFAHPRAAGDAAFRRHEPEHTALYQVVEAHWDAFLERAEEVGGLPKFVVREFEEYLRCGRLEHGCLHLECRSCGHSQLVALSCKRRGFCPSCCGRRMADTAAHLVREVLPEVPIRHWICSLPWRLRALLGYDRKLCAAVIGGFVAEVMSSLKRRAKRLLGLRSVRDAHTGAIASIQRTDSALRLNVHAHVLALDGCYVRPPAGGLVWHALPTPTQAEVADVASRTAARIERILKAHGRSMDPQMQQDEPALADEQPGLAACYTAAAQGVSISGARAGQATLRLLSSNIGSSQGQGGTVANEPAAEVRGVNVHAKQVIDGRDRPKVERLCKYVTRPPVAQDRLELQDDGRVLLSLKKVWRDGTRALLFEPHDLLTRLVAAVPPPRLHMLRYFGVLSSHSSLRAEVVPSPPLDPTRCKPPPAVGDQLPLLERPEVTPLDDDKPKRSRSRWGWLLKRTFSHDVDHCARCGGPMRWVEAATAPNDVARLLAKHGLAPRPPPAKTTPTIGQLALPFGRH